jgi:ABC-type molybdate transport system substrate-binding protein
VASAGQPETLQIYAAGSLRAVISGLAAEAGPVFGVEVKPTFGGSGSLRERIQKGETPDLFMSADVGSPRQLAAQGRTVVPVIAFARNRMCVVSRKSAGVTAANLIDRMLAAGVRLKTSAPIVDPGGDYAWSIFKRAEVLHPGAQAILEHKAEASMKLVAQPVAATQSAAAALFAAHAIDMSITYCSGSAGLVKEMPELTSLPVPPDLDPHPLYGVAVLSAKPAVLRMALFLLSEQGQEIIAKAGLVPLTDTAGTQP